MTGVIIITFTQMVIMSRHKTFCSVIESGAVCGKPTASRGMCVNHRYAFKKHGDPLFRLAAPISGRSKDPLYKIWGHMYSRCYDVNHKQYSGYGGRGIDIHDSWNKDVMGWKAFDNFKRDVGERPKGTHISGKPVYTLDRIDNDKGYSPDNVRWATYQEQNSNTRKNNEVVGVGFDKARGQWKARLTVDGVNYLSKRFDTYSEAVDARTEAENIYNKESK